MIRLLTDENYDGDIVRGLLRQLPALDVVRVQDAGLEATPDLAILVCVAKEEAKVIISLADTFRER